MRELMYKVTDSTGLITYADGIKTYAEAVSAIEKFNGALRTEYKTIHEENRFDRAKCKKSEEWLKRHSLEN